MRSHAARMITRELQRLGDPDPSRHADELLERIGAAERWALGERVRLSVECEIGWTTSTEDGQW